MKRNVIIAVIANLIFGIMPIYWKFLAGVSNVYVLGYRMVWSILFTIAFAAIEHKLGLLKAAFRNKRALLISLLSKAGLLRSVSRPPRTKSIMTRLRPFERSTPRCALNMISKRLAAIAKNLS